MKLYQSFAVIIQVLTLIGIFVTYSVLSENRKDVLINRGIALEINDRVQDNSSKVNAMWQQRLEGKTNADMVRETKDGKTQ